MQIVGQTWFNHVPCDIDFFCESVNVSMTYISWYSEFALYLEDCLMYEHHTLG